MSRIDLRWLAHHPLRWVRVVWFHLLIAGLIFGKAILITNPIWDVTATATVWPLIVASAGMLVVASAVALSHDGLQRFTAYTLFVIAATRALTYSLLIFSDASSATTVVLAQAFALQWATIALFATRWPLISTAARYSVTTQAGEDALGRLRATGS